MVYASWTTPSLQPPQPCSPVSSVPILLSSAHSLPSLMFPYFGLDGEEWPPPNHNSWTPSPAPSRYSTLNAPGIHGIVYVSGFSYCLAAVVITGMQKESLLQHLSHLWSDPKIWAQIFAFGQDAIFYFLGGWETQTVLELLPVCRTNLHKQHVSMWFLSDESRSLFRRALFHTLYPRHISRLISRLINSLSLDFGV